MGTAHLSYKHPGQDGSKGAVMDLKMTRLSLSIYTCILSLVAFVAWKHPVKWCKEWWVCFIPSKSLGGLEIIFKMYFLFFFCNSNSSQLSWTLNPIFREKSQSFSLWKKEGFRLGLCCLVPLMAWKWEWVGQTDIENAEDSYWSY